MNIFFKKKLFKYYFLVIFLFGVSLFLFFVFDNMALALSANYNKVSGDALSSTEWNELSNDFLANSGGLDGGMGGNLDVSNNRMTTVGDYSGSSDVVNREYVDNLSASASGGSIFTNWGRGDCPSGTEELYKGFAFGTAYVDGGGSSNNICIQVGTAGNSYLGSDSGKVYPLTTSPDSVFLPSGMPTAKFIQCAVCYKSGSSCYLKSGSSSCDGSYNVVYHGYFLGAIRTASVHYSSRKRECVNSDFENVTISGTSPASSVGIMYGSRIEDNFGLSDYTTASFVNCAVCCN